MKHSIKSLVLEMNYNKDLRCNEPRISNNDLLEEKIFFPFSDIYFNIDFYTNNILYDKILYLPNISYLNDNTMVDRDWFLRKLESDRIKYAIIFLQTEALKTFIIKNYKNIIFENPFFYLYSSVYPIDKNIDVVKEIIKILIDNYNNYYDLINKLINSFNNKILDNLLLSFLPDDKDNLCSICLTTEPKELLINICKCKTPIHSKCFIKYYEHKKLTNCSVCLSKYKINEINSFDNKIYFPYNDIYFKIGTNILIKVNGMERLNMAIIYLQVERVKELLKEKEIIDNLSTFYIGNNYYKQTPLIALAIGNLPSNYSIFNICNKQKYIDIFKMLLDTNKISLEHKDAFNKNVYDYINKHTTSIFDFINYKNNKLTLINNTLIFINCYNITYTFNKNENKFSLNINPNVYIYDSRYNNKIAKRIYYILENINKLSDGNIKMYQIHTELELHVLCIYLLQKNILFKMFIKNMSYVEDSFYGEFSQKKYLLKQTSKHFEYNKYMNNVYIKVCKGFINKKKYSNSEHKYQIYL